MMSHKLVALLLCLILSGLPSAQSRAQNPSTRTSPSVQATQGLPTSKIEKIESLVAAWMAQHKAPALSVAVVADNQMRFAKGYGLADVENNVAARGETAYRLASITKSITAVAVMQLAERGKLDLDAPVQKYCAAYPEKQYLVTPRLLLTHFAGVRHNRPAEVVSTKHYGSINEAIGSFKDDPLLHEPAAKYSYSTPGYTLLGCAIEGASGMSYMDYLRENVFQPAGMTRTQVDDVYAIIPHRARGYRKTQAGEVVNAPLHDTSIKIPGGGTVSTVEDLARFAVALNGGTLVKKETLEQMWTKPKTRDGKESGYAMGFLIGERNGRRLIFNDGSQAGTRTYIFMLPEERFAVALMTNLERAWCEELAPKIADVVLDARPMPE